MHFFPIFAIIICGYDTFFLTPFYHIKGVFNIADLGNFFMWVYLLVAFLNGRLPRLFTGIGAFILLYLLMVTVHIAIASFFYGQSILDGVLAARHQAYYMMYFVFLTALDTEERINKFFSILSYVVMGVIFLSVVNYFGITLFYHEKWAEGHGVRSGITRAFVPGMNLINLLFVWFLAKYLSDNKLFSRNGVGVFFFFLALVFRQTRGRVLAALVTMFAMLVSVRRLKLALAIIVFGVVFLLAMSPILQENIVKNLLVSAFTDVSEGEGTWSPRLVTLEHSMDAFYKHPIVGNGSLVLRNSVEAGQDLYILSYQADLGYAHWLKNFGLIGVSWLLFLSAFVYQTYSKNKKRNPYDWQMQFAFFAYFQVMFSMITLNYLVKVDGIIVLCLILAVVSRRNLINTRY